MERRRSERDLLRLYLDAVRAAGGTHISFDEAWSAHRVQAGYTVVATFLAFMPSYAGPERRPSGSHCERAANWPSTNSRSSTPYGAAIPA